MQLDSKHSRISPHISRLEGGVGEMIMMVGLHTFVEAFTVFPFLSELDGRNCGGYSASLVKTREIDTEFKPWEMLQNFFGTSENN